jgi:phenylalanyl-tRNA synthetase alpha chain
MNNSLKQTILQTQQECTTALDQAQTQDTIEKIRVQYLGRQGICAQLMEQITAMSQEEKREFGPLLNNLKKDLQQALADKKEQLLQAELQTLQAQKANFDVTAYKRQEFGSLHPYTHVTKELVNIFTSMGFAVAQGPELESEFHNFTALNIPENHPARGESDTFWMPDFKRLLRTHTSTVQMRVMQEQQPPIAVIAPGRVFRNEATDATHDFQFMQIEGMFIDTNVSVSNMLAVIETFLKQLLGNEIQLRVRPGFFPFVEPGLEFDVLYQFEKDKPARWMELGGCGMIHPNVLRHGNIDPEKYSGFAFGFGLTRLTMLKYNIKDLRLLHSSSIAFLSQF